MSLNDHRLTWQFRVHGTPDQCMEAFAAAFPKGRGGTGLVSSRWQLRRPSSNTAEAIYEGRNTVASVASGLSRRAVAEEGAAVGSTLTFTVAGFNEQKNVTQCSLRLTRSTRLMIFFIADARFLRSAMNGVTRSMSRLDANHGLVKA